MSYPTNGDKTNVLWLGIMEPAKRMFKELIKRFFEDGEATTYLVTLGTVSSNYVSGRPTVIFDRDTVASGKTYPFVSSYQPAANDRVIMMRSGGTWVVMGKVL